MNRGIKGRFDALKVGSWFRFEKHRMSVFTSPTFDIILFYYCFEPFYCILLCCTQKRANCYDEEKDLNLVHV